jgi:hypothetical protein
MLKRLTWFAAGAAAGVGGTVAAGLRVRRTVQQLAPDHLARTTVNAAKDRVADVADAWRAGRSAMRTKEAQLRALAEGHPSGTEGSDGGDRPNVIDISSGRGGRRR